MKYWGGLGLYSIGVPMESVAKYESALGSGSFLVLAYGIGGPVEQRPGNRTDCAPNGDRHTRGGTEATGRDWHQLVPLTGKRKQFGFRSERLEKEKYHA
jgi:hypothetical protein